MNLLEILKTNIAQQTDVFNISTTPKKIKVYKNEIEITGEEGEFVITGADDMCINRLIELELNKNIVLDDCYLGDAQREIDVNLVKINAGEAINRHLALEIIEESELPMIVVYWESKKNTQKSYYDSAGNSNIHNILTTFGVLVAIEPKNNSVCSDIDTHIMQIFANHRASDNSTMVRFDNIASKTFVGSKLVIDYKFSYMESIGENDIIADRQKTFDVGIECFK